MGTNYMRFLLLCTFLVKEVFTAPSDSQHSLVVGSTEPATPEESDEENVSPPDITPSVPQIYQMHVKSNISNRFAHTTITSRVKNSATKSQEATFSIVLPETAFISRFCMEVELLKREDGHYEQMSNLHPGQPVKDLSVKVTIQSNHHKRLSLTKHNSDLEIINNKTAMVIFRPNIKRQKQLAHVLGTSEDEGLAGQFVVQYDVERDPNGREILVLDGYFVHFFAPTELAPLPKHVANGLGAAHVAVSVCQCQT
ncbi:hypothetical protein ILUMI_18894 [Ignelater luminosus]|uniref:VIT domain-containing protein n=1 Tax=Ignelater luminosus TaxID=2038154 RepID=A0A8K0G5Y9_IGNLU|nr:hypothetical protein ILUMI_18894 [Ignelater luminosus]